VTLCVLHQLRELIGLLGRNIWLRALLVRQWWQGAETFEGVAFNDALWTRDRAPVLVECRQRRLSGHSILKIHRLGRWDQLIPRLKMIIAVACLLDILRRVHRK